MKCFGQKAYLPLFYNLDKFRKFYWLQFDSNFLTNKTQENITSRAVNPVSLCEGYCSRHGSLLGCTSMETLNDYSMLEVVILCHDQGLCCSPKFYRSATYPSFSVADTFLALHAGHLTWTEFYEPLLKASYFCSWRHKV